jgi:hypothetical protein
MRSLFTPMAIFDKNSKNFFCDSQIFRFKKNFNDDKKQIKKKKNKKCFLKKL